MKRYVVYAKDLSTLDALIEGTDVTVGYRGKYVPIAELRTALTHEELGALLPGYDIHEQKTYEVNDDTGGS